MITVVIPVHNRLAYTRQCLLCLALQTYRNFQVVVVDDGSTDGTAEMIRQEFTDVVVLHGDGNLWWTEATNWGIRYAQKHQDRRQENFVLTLNDDTRIGADYLQTMLDAYRRHRPCLIGSVSVNSNDPERLEYAGTSFELYTASGRHLSENFHNRYSELVRRASYIDSHSLPGRGTLIPMEVFDRVGLFDSQHYIHYMSDIEFSVRARKAGYRLIVNVSSLVYEYTEATGIQVERNISLKEFITGFTSIKSPTNLKARYNFAIAHSKTKLIYFCFDVARICTGFMLRKVRIMKFLN